jgi:hypothetical protein
MINAIIALPAIDAAAVIDTAVIETAVIAMMANAVT